MNCSPFVRLVFGILIIIPHCLTKGEQFTSPGIYINSAESGLYYLNSRYYDPKIGRFVNTDNLSSMVDSALRKNLFAYCFNNPVNLSDGAGRIRL
jgi:RHS repeat-associated protein